MNIPTGILKNWSITGDIQASEDNGLINDTYVIGAPPSAILQRVNPIFDSSVHDDIEKITDHIERAGMLTPRLVRTVNGDLCLPSEQGTWRVLSFVDGTTIHTISNPRQAASAAELVGRFHRATADLDHDFSFIRPGAHDTNQHMETLEAAARDADSGSVQTDAKQLAERILAAWQHWDGDLDLPLRVCHGDLKISNIRFAQDRETALCLLDFDTFSHQTIAVEMGDAWRSWCNPAGENQLDDVRFDIDIFKASAQAWLSSGPTLEPLERENLVMGIQRICLELSARFCADAIRKTYFKEDQSRFPTPGSHNLYRALGQFKLAESVDEHRAEAEAIVQAG